MSMLLDPEQLFQRLMEDLPIELQSDIFVVGSLAAAYHFRVKLQQQGVNTKDADLVVHPAGNTSSCAGMAERLLDSLGDSVRFLLENPGAGRLREFRSLRARGVRSWVVRGFHAYRIFY